MNIYALTPRTVPTPSHLSAISPILDTLSTTNMQHYLAILTSFNNRHYPTSTGKAAIQYIFDTVTAVRLPLAILRPFTQKFSSIRLVRSGPR